MTEIYDRLRDHYRGVELSSQQLEELADQGHQNALSNRWLSPGEKAGISWVAAALLLLTISFRIHGYGTNSERTSRTLQEAAMNHSTRLELEFKSNSIVEIDQHMSQLPFNVQLPSEFKEQYSVLGARYCTINGELAAHVKFINPETEQQVSLFMTRSVDDLRAIKDTSEQVDGVSVSLWNESGLFYAMASLPGTNP